MVLSCFFFPQSGKSQFSGKLFHKAFKYLNCSFEDQCMWNTALDYKTQKERQNSVQNVYCLKVRLSSFTLSPHFTSSSQALPDLRVLGLMHSCFLMLTDFHSLPLARTQENIIVKHAVLVPVSNVQSSLMGSIS